MLCCVSTKLAMSEHYSCINECLHTHQHAYTAAMLMCIYRITDVIEDTIGDANCGRYSITGYVLGTSDGSKPNITVSVAGLYDVTNELNSCSSQAAY